MASAALNSERLLSARLRYVFCYDVDGGSEKLGIWEIPGSKLPIRLGKYYISTYLALLGLGLIKINDVSANFNNPRPSLILNN